MPNVREVIRDVNLEYLCEKRLIKGNTASVDGKITFSAVEITAVGIDMVENEVKRQNTARKRLGKLRKKFSANASVWNVVARLVTYFSDGATDI